MGSDSVAESVALSLNRPLCAQPTGLFKSHTVVSKKPQKRVLLPKAYQRQGINQHRAVCIAQQVFKPAFLHTTCHNTRRIYLVLCTQKHNNIILLYFFKIKPQAVVMHQLYQLLKTDLEVLINKLPSWFRQLSIQVTAESGSTQVIYIQQISSGTHLDWKEVPEVLW